MRLRRNGAIYCSWCRRQGLEWNAQTCQDAARNGRLRHKNGCPSDEATCMEAAKLGHLPLLPCFFTTTVPGTSRHALLRRRMAIWRWCKGATTMAVQGMKKPAYWRRQMDIWMFSNGAVTTTFPGTNKRVKPNSPHGFQICAIIG